MLAFLWFGTELVHGAESAKDHFLFKGWGRDAELWLWLVAHHCKIMLWGMGKIQVHELKSSHQSSWVHLWVFSDALCMLVYSLPLPKQIQRRMAGALLETQKWSFLEIFEGVWAQSWVTGSRRSHLTGGLSQMISIGLFQPQTFWLCENNPDWYWSVFFQMWCS